MGNAPSGQVDNVNESGKFNNNVTSINQGSMPVANEAGNVNNLVYNAGSKSTESKRIAGSVGTICANDLRSNMPQNFVNLAAMFAENDRGGKYEFRHNGPC